MQASVCVCVHGFFCAPLTSRHTYHTHTHTQCGILFIFEHPRATRKSPSLKSHPLPSISQPISHTTYKVNQLRACVRASPHTPHDLHPPPSRRRRGTLNRPTPPYARRRSTYTHAHTHSHSHSHVRRISMNMNDATSDLARLHTTLSSAFLVAFAPDFR